jgi:hypothetical protein
MTPFSSQSILCLCVNHLSFCQGARRLVFFKEARLFSVAFAVVDLSERGLSVLDAWHNGAVTGSVQQELSVLPYVLTLGNG